MRPAKVFESGPLLAIEPDVLAFVVTDEACSGGWGMLDAARNADDHQASFTQANLGSRTISSAGSGPPGREAFFPGVHTPSRPGGERALVPSTLCPPVSAV